MRNNFIKLFCCVFFLSTFCIACGSVPEITKEQIFDKQPLKVALRIEPGTYNYLRTKHWGDRKQEQAIFDINVNAEKITRKIFTEGLKDAFAELSQDVNDCDLIFSVHISTAKAEQIFLKKDDYDVSSEIVYEINITDSSGTAIEHFKGEGRYQGDGKKGSDALKFLAITYASMGTGWVLTPWMIEANYTKSLAASATIAFNQILGDMKWSEPIRQTMQSKLHRTTEPARLAAKVQFSDTDSFAPNDSVDAGETSRIEVKITNNGSGTGFAAKLFIESDNKDIHYQKEYELGDIQPEGTREVQVPVRADINLPDGKADFTFKVTEKRNFDAKPVILRVATRHMDRPQLVIVSHEINDGKTGMAIGNENGVPENGETVELTAFVANTGIGDAHGVRLMLQEMNAGIQIEQKEAYLGAIAPNQTSKGKVVFSIPRTFSGQGIACTLGVTDARPGLEAAKSIALGFEQKRPALAYVSRILSRGVEASNIANGETVELEITPRNEGGIPAKNLQISIDASAINSTPDSKSIHELLPGAVGAPQRFEIPVPRSYTQTELPIHVSMSQTDFEGKRDTIAVPIKVKAPKLTYTAVISGKHGGNVVEQNERVSLDVQIQNGGDLDAKNVRVGLHIGSPDIKMKNESEILIPTIPAHGFSETIKFDFFVYRRAPAGDLPARIHISQADFPSAEFPHNLLVKAERAEIIEIAGASQRKAVGNYAPAQRNVPIVVIGKPAAGTRVNAKSIDLAGTVVDQRGIDEIKAELNGRPFRVSTRGASDRKEFFATLPLAQGENNIRLIARNRDNISSEEATVVYREDARSGGSNLAPLSMFCDLDGDILGMPVSPNPDERKWAVVIGLEEYRSPDVPAVLYARRDAQAFKEYLTRRQHVPEENIFVLMDRDALLTELIDLLEDRLPARVNSGDTVYFYFAGHGIPDIETRTPYLLPYDGKTTNPRRTAFSASDLYETLGQLKAERVFVFLDSCFSGAGRSADEQQTLIAKARPAGFIPRDPVLKHPNIIVFSATESSQICNVYKEKQHGIFTYFLLKRMVDNNGPLKISELDRYLKDNVSRQAEREYGPNRRQTPVLNGVRASEDMVIVE